MNLPLVDSFDTHDADSLWPYFATLSAKDNGDVKSSLLHVEFFKCWFVSLVWNHVVDCSRSELKKVTDIFTRMFHDPHGKVFSVFLDSLVQLVLVHHNDMSDWLYVLLTRLLTKTGADMLGSVHAKVQRALDVVRWVRLLVLSYCSLFIIIIISTFFFHDYSWVRRLLPNMIW